MKKIIPVVLILALLIWLLFPKQEHEKEKIQTPTIVKKQQDPLPKKKQEVDYKEIIRAGNEKVQARFAKEELDQKTNEPNLDFITAYRDYKYFETCQYVFEFSINKMELNLSHQFNKSFNANQRITMEPSSQQLSYLTIHTDKCNSYFGSETKYFQAEVSRMVRRYQRITPKSEKAKQLKRALDLQYEMIVINGQLRQARKGTQKDSQLHRDYFLQLRDLRKKIQKLRSLSKSNFGLNIIIAGEEDVEISKLKEQISDIEKLKKENFFIDNELIEKLSKKRQDSFKPIEDFLKQNNSPDAFLLLTNILITEKSEFDNDFIKQIQTKFKFYDVDYFDSLNEIVYPLVACYLDYPCDDESMQVIGLCLDNQNKESMLACGNNLEDFYLNNYLSPNQTIDLNNYFNYLLEFYVKK